MFLSYVFGGLGKRVHDKNYKDAEKSIENQVLEN
jgi:hypothetical protein